MQAPRPTPREQERQALLEGLAILDTPPEQRFDRIVQFAALHLQVPIVIMTLVDRDRQWFKARTGLAPTETPRAVSFCGHAIHDDRVMVVEDARADARFVDNPLVTGDPGIRFYAGAPLVLADGLRLGTLCLIDRQARRLHPVEQQVLCTLRDLLVDELRLHPMRQTV
jgi:GAF domain-containing protein